MPDTNTITVYCASSAAIPESYLAAAERLGRLIAESGRTLVFGGGGQGSMGRLATGALAAGGRVVGIMPHFMRELEWMHRGAVDFVWTEDMARRKHLLAERADALVALPGGCGTFEELLEVMCLKRLGLCPKPIIVVNQEGFYDSLRTLMDRSIREGFMHPKHAALASYVSTVDEVLTAIDTTPPWDPDARSFAVLRA